MVGCWCFGGRKQQRQLTLLLVGLDNAGKTSILNHLQGGASEVTPTFGFSSASIAAAGCRLQLYDLGGSKNIRRIWRVYTPEVHGIVYVVDAADPARFQESCEALQQLLQNKHLAGKPALVLANKQDMQSAETCEQVAEALQVHQLQQDRASTVFPCTAKSDQQQQAQPNAGLQQGLQWLVMTIAPLYSQLQARIETEAAEARATEQRHRHEREQRARLNRMERLQQEKEAAQQAEQQQERQVQQADLLVKAVISPRDASVEPMEQMAPAASLQESSATSAPHALHCSTLLHAQAGPDKAAWPAAAASHSGDAHMTAAIHEGSSPAEASMDSPDAVAAIMYRAATVKSPSLDGCQSQPAAAAGLINFLQAALPGAAPSPEFCDLQQAVHEACGTTPRCDSLDSEASSILELGQLRKTMKQHTRAQPQAAT